MNEKSLKYTCVFGGGAIRGISYVGAIKALEEMNIDIGTIAGSSVGSVIASLYAAGCNSDELREFCYGVNFDFFRDIHFGFGKDFALSKGEVFVEKMREAIEKKFYGENYRKGQNPAVTFKDLKRDLVIVTTDLTNFKFKEFSKKETPDFEVAQAVRFSSTMPGLMKTLSYNNVTLVDGDFVKSWPQWKLTDSLYPKEGRVLEFRLEGDRDSGEINNPINYANLLYSCWTAMSTKFIAGEFGKNDKFDYIVINTGNVLVVDFNQSLEKREHLEQLGYEQTMDYFKNSLAAKKRDLYEKYKSLLIPLKKMALELERGKISQVQIELGNLYMQLSEVQRCIDKADYEKVRNFKVEFCKNLVETFFHKPKLKNFVGVSAMLNKLILDISAKMHELKDYNFN